MRILLYTLDFNPTADPVRFTAAAAPHYRLELPCGALAELGGHEATLVHKIWSDSRTGRIMGEDLCGETVADAEILVFQALAPAEEIQAARRAGQIAVCDLTDTPEVPLTHIYYDLIEYTRAAGLAMYRACDALTVTSAYLRDYMRSIPGCPPVHLLRNPIAPDEWGPPAPVRKRPVLGWCGSLLERADDCSVLRPWLGDFLERHDLQFIHVGDGPIGAPGRPRAPMSFAEAANIDAERVERRPVRTFADYLATRPWSGIDIQLVPLMDHHYSRGKSCLKGLESAAQGIPFVASPQEEYRWLACGRLAGVDIAHQEPKLWIGALEAMLDPTERSRLANEARERVAEEDIKLRWKEWESVYAEALYRRRST